MRLRDTGMGFGVITIGMHWVGAFLVIAFTLASLAALLLPSVTPGRGMILLGVLSSAVSSFRLIWRFTHFYPLPMAPKPPVVLIAQRTMALALLLGGAVLPWLFFSLLARSTTAGLPDLFSVFPQWVIAALFWAGSLLVILTALVHAGAAIFGALARGDRSLERILGQKLEP